ncbi:MAG TPA: hypothetical protein VND94_01085 [Terriglobia bacterium]|nr:hypothetical protein [Terriglobia bacterium]
MTVIAYRDGIMAADSLMQLGSTKARCRKIAKHRGHLIGLSGNVCPPLDTFIELFFSEDEDDRRFLSTFDFDALIVTPAGEIQVWEQRLCFETPPVPFWAIGSGQDCAMGAMEMGATAKQAAAAAIKWVPNIGGPVTTRSLK